MGISLNQAVVENSEEDKINVLVPSKHRLTTLSSVRFSRRDPIMPQPAMTSMRQPAAISNAAGSAPSPLKSTPELSAAAE